MVLEALLTAWIPTDADTVMKRLMTGLGTLPNVQMTYRLMELGALAAQDRRACAALAAAVGGAAARGGAGPPAGARRAAAARSAAPRRPRAQPPGTALPLARRPVRARRR